MSQMRRRMMARQSGGGSPIPPQYAEVAGIRCIHRTSGAEYFNTGKKGFNNTIEVRFTLDSQPSRFASVFGADNNYCAYTAYAPANIAVSLNWRDNFIFSYGGLGSHTLKLDPTAKTVTYDGEVYTTTDSPIDSEYQIFLFARNIGGTPTSQGAVNIINYCRIWDSNGNLIYNAVPVIRLTDNSVGFYDTVAQSFDSGIVTGNGHFEEVV